MSTLTDKTTRAGSTTQRRLRPAFEFFTRYNTIIIGVLIFVAASVLSDTFLTARNQTNVLRQTAPIAISAMGMLLVILTGGIDLSVGSAVALTTVVTAQALRAMRWAAARPAAMRRPSRC